MRQRRREGLRDAAAGIPIAGPFVPVVSPRRSAPSGSAASPRPEPVTVQAGIQQLSERLATARVEREERSRPPVYDIPDDEDDEDVMGLNGGEESAAASRALVNEVSLELLAQQGIPIAEERGFGAGVRPSTSLPFDEEPRPEETPMTRS